MAVRKLREIRAIVGFQRGALPPDPIFTQEEVDSQYIAQMGESRQFPAYENRGEGIFVRFSPEPLRAFLNNEGVKRRAALFQRAEEAMGGAIWSRLQSTPASCVYNGSFPCALNNKAARALMWLFSIFFA